MIRPAWAVERGVPPTIVRARVWQVCLGAVLVLLCVEAGKMVSSGSVRGISLVLGRVFAACLARLRPAGVLAVTLALSPLPLYVQGLRTSLVVALVVGVWLSLLAHSTTASAVVRSAGLRGYRLPLLAVGATSVVALWRGAGDRTGADLGALGRLAVGVALFAGCLFVIRSMRDLRIAIAAVGLAGTIVLTVTMLQVALPSLHIPGLLTSDSGTVQQGLYGIARNLRVSGPLGDYELLAELFGLIGSLGAYLGLRSRGRARLAWLSLVPTSLAGIAVTSTRSGLIVLVLGCGLSVLGRGAVRRWFQLVPIGAGVWLLGFPALHLLQTHSGTGFLFNRSLVSGGSGIAGILDRGNVWGFFLDRLPQGTDLVFGRSLAFDYERYGTFPHSLPLTLVFTVGIAGAIAFYWLLAAVLWQCARAARAGVPYAGLGALLVFLFALDEIKIEYLRVFSYQWFVWGLLGVCAAAARITAAEPSPNGEAA